MLSLEVGVLRWWGAMAAGVAVRIFVWIRRLAYRIDGARLGIVRCWGLAAVGGLGLICWLACCFFFRWKGLSCFSGSTLSIVFWFSPVSSLSHHQDICYTEYVHIKIMKEETNGTHHRRTTRNQRPRPRHPRHPRSHLHDVFGEDTPALVVGEESPSPFQ